MSDSGNRSLELQVTNQTTENLVIYNAHPDNNTSQWMAGEQPVIGATVNSGSSALWGVVATNSTDSAAGEVRLEGSGGSSLGFVFQNLYNGICTVEVELGPKLAYAVQPIAAVDQIQTTARVVVTSS